jgi:hypothetical protein
MSVTSIVVPYSFIDARILPSWTAVKFGIESGFLKHESAIELARDRLTEASPRPELVKLASSNDVTESLALIDSLSHFEKEMSLAEVREFWAFLLLYWVYENRGAIDDPLGIVESIYDDLDYPSDVAVFVRYMPMVGPDLGSREDNEERLMSRWKAYLDQMVERYGVMPRSS